VPPMPVDGDHVSTGSDNRVTTGSDNQGGQA
jgi:hypothetical protein